ncbi:MAG: exodeoxyribonuclease I [Pseudomonadota bacterium]
MNTYYWHDYEAWGAKPSADKPSQFAGIRTDENFTIIGEPLCLYCKPSADCLPHPEACLLTGITPQKAMAEGLPEPEFFRVIESELSQPGTCGVGYNSIRFDDEMTRHGFYRNFYDPYEREWNQGNSRWDIIDMTRLVYALRPDTLAWPEREPGVPSFKLEALTKANGLVHESAHDALSDVYATIALAKLIKERQPRLYDYAYQLRNKRRAAQLIDIQQCKPLLHISSRFPAAQGCAALVAPLMMHPSNRNSVIAYNLSIDPSPLAHLSASEIAERVYAKQEDLPEGLERIPLKEIHLNKAPILATPKLLDDSAAQRLGIDKAACDKHWQQLCSMTLQGVLTEVYQGNAFPPQTDPEQQLYNAFIDDADKQHFPAIRQAEPQQLISFMDQLQDDRLKALLFRYRARFYPHTLSDEERQQWQQWRYQRLTDKDAGASIVLDEYFECLDGLGGDPSVSQTILAQLFEYGDQLLGE